MSAAKHHALRSFGFASEVEERLIAALARPLPEACPDPREAALENELFVPDWIECCLEARRAGPAAALRNMLWELNFPVAPGISKTPEYANPALAGNGAGERAFASTKEGVAWQAPERLRVFMHDSGAGLLPVIHAAEREDFVTLIRALVHRNEPAAVPASMGASFLNGYHNRQRHVRALEAAEQGLLPRAACQPSLWKDRLLLLTHGLYSGVPAVALGRTDAEWMERSTRLRLAHESCHYAVRRLFPRLKFGLQDELAADFAGLMEADGVFRAEAFLLFMGLEKFPAYRPGGRLENYGKGLAADPAMLHALGAVLAAAARQVEAFFAGWPPERYARHKLAVWAALTFVPLEHLASPEAAQWLQRVLPGS